MSLMSKTLVSSNILTNVAQQSYMAHCNMWFRMGRETDDDFIFHAPNRNAIDVSRNQAAKMALECDCDYLLMYDDDSLPHPQTYMSLKKADKDVIMALSYIRGYPFEPMFFKFGGQAINPDTDVKSSLLLYYRDFAEAIDKDGLVVCDAVGFHCVLIKCSLLKKMQPPYFVTYPGASTEDVYFCMKAKKEVGKDVSICVDTKVPAGHLLQPVVVDQTNVNELRLFHHPNKDAVDKKEMPEQPYPTIIDHDPKEIEKWLESV